MHTATSAREAYLSPGACRGKIGLIDGITGAKARVLVTHARTHTRPRHSHRSQSFLLVCFSLSLLFLSPRFRWRRQRRGLQANWVRAGRPHLTLLINK